MEDIHFENSGKLLRIADSLETNATTGFLSVSGTIEKSIITARQCLENIKKNYKSILSYFSTLRLKLILKDNIPYWYYSTNEELKFDKLIKIVDEPFEDEVPLSYDLSQPLWKVKLTQFEDKTKIRLICCHCIIDGRAIFDLFEIFALSAIGKPYTERLNSYKNQPTLYEYGKKDWYISKITEKKIENPFDEKIMNKIRINPKISAPSHFINPQWEVPYEPISKFCKFHKVSPQSILMAIQNEAVRNFNKDLKDDFLIPLYIPVDNRNTPYSSDLYKKCLFYTHVGFILPFIEKENDILTNIKNCYNKLKEGLNNTFTCDFNYYLANMRDFKTGKILYEACYPNGACFSFASHIGLVCTDFKDIQFRTNNPIYPDFYWACFYGFHNKETFYFMYSIPYNCPDYFFQSVKEVSLKFYDFIVKNIENLD